MDRLVMLVAAAIAALAAVASLAAPVEMAPVLVDSRVGLLFFCVWTAGAVSFAFAMPRLRAGFFIDASRRRLPWYTYFIPHWMLRLLVGMTIGQTIGVLVLAIIDDRRMFWMAGAFGCIAAAFYAGARPRLKKGAHNEFVMPWWPRPWR